MASMLASKASDGGSNPSVPIWLSEGCNRLQFIRTKAASGKANEHLCPHS